MKTPHGSAPEPLDGSRPGSDNLRLPGPIAVALGHAGSSVSPPVRRRSRDRDFTISGSRPETVLVITGGIFSKEVLIELVDDCIVPALVDEFLRTRRNLPDHTNSVHNETQL
jgi:hypothetical protein